MTRTLASPWNRRIASPRLSAEIWPSILVYEMDAFVRIDSTRLSVTVQYENTTL